VIEHHRDTDALKIADLASWAPVAAVRTAALRSRLWSSLMGMKEQSG
jgi:hypothetical protein